MHGYDDTRGRGAGVIYVLMLVIAIGFGAFVWQLYSAPDVPHIAAEPGPYKMAAAPEAAPAPDQGEAAAATDATPALTTPEVEAPAVEDEPMPAGGPPQLA